MSERWDVLQGDSLQVLPTLQGALFDSAVTDPPYELGFMGKAWDASGIAYNVDLWREVLRVLKPGGHLLAFGGTRTYHRMACAIEDAGFEIRDSLHWMYGTGFPKSLTANTGMPEGQGTALKPGHEPIVLARKPLEGTVSANVLKWGTGGLNIDGCRIEGVKPQVTQGINSNPTSFAVAKERRLSGDPNEGRWPANVLLDEDAARELDAQSGISVSRANVRNNSAFKSVAKGAETARESFGHADSGGASRFFYVAKPEGKERNVGCGKLPKKSAGEATNRKEGSEGLNNPRAGAGRTSGNRNIHPTVKPIELIRWLVRLVTPKGGLVLDPFTGSGTHGAAALMEGMRFVGVELSPEYAEIARERIRAAEGTDSVKDAISGQLSILAVGQ